MATSLSDTAAYSLRPARDEDLDTLLAIEHASFSTDHLSRRQYRRHLHSPSAAVFVATDANGVLGKAVVFFRRGSDVARLYSIAVAAAGRGRGIGETLLEEAERVARARGCAWLRLEVRQDNAAAMRLYERRGYERFAERRGYYEDGADAWRYEKRLTTPVPPPAA